MNLPTHSVSIYKQVMDRKQAIVSEIASLGCKQTELKQQLADIDGFLRTCGRIAPNDEISPEAATTSPATQLPRVKKPNKQEIVAKAVIDILSSGDVLTTNQILDQLADRGIPVGGKNPSGNLSSMLSKTSGIVNSRSAKGWMLRAAHT